MIYFEITLYYSNDLNPYTDLSLRQQAQLILVDVGGDPYLSSEKRTRYQREEISRILFDGLWNDYFKVTKTVGSRSFVVPVWT